MQLSLHQALGTVT